MKNIIKLIMAAVLSLSVGVAFAAPLYVADMDIRPFPRMQGPVADASISVVYANFTISKGNMFLGSSPTFYLNYEVVLNVTNLSDLNAEVTRLGFTAGQQIQAAPTTVGIIEYLVDATADAPGEVSMHGGELCVPTSEDIVPGTNWVVWSSMKNGVTLAGGSGLVRGVWLDGCWINVTWILGPDYPGWPAPPGGWHPKSSGSNEMPPLSETWPTTTTVPSMPTRAAVEGTLVEGVPIIEMHNITKNADGTASIATRTAIFINGTWVDVTSRVRTTHQSMYIRATNAVAAEIRSFSAAPTGSIPNATDIQPDGTTSARTTEGWRPYRAYTPTGIGEFNNQWAPHQSRLILLKGTREVVPNLGIDSLAAGKVTLLAEELNHVQDASVNSTELYTYSGEHWLMQVPVQKTSNGYIYNALLDENQMLQPDQWGVEVFIKQGS
jgi:hypothetical protein